MKHQTNVNYCGKLCSLSSLNWDVNFTVEKTESGISMIHYPFPLLEGLERVGMSAWHELVQIDSLETV